MGEMRILTSASNKHLILDQFKEDWQEGDLKIIWDPDKVAEVEAAEEQFNRMIKEGYTAFEVGARGAKTSKKVDEFDPNLGKIIMVQAVAGG